MKKDLSFGALLTTITACLFGFCVAISPAFWCLSGSMNMTTSKITNPTVFLGVVGCVLLIIFGLVALILSIIGIFKKGKGLAIATMVFQGLLLVGAILAFVGGINVMAGLEPEEILLYGLQCYAPFAALILVHAGAFVLKLFSVLNMKKEKVCVETPVVETENK